MALKKDKLDSSGVENIQFLQKQKKQPRKKRIVKKQQKQQSSSSSAVESDKESEINVPSSFINSNTAGKTKMIPVNDTYQLFKWLNNFLTESRAKQSPIVPQNTEQTVEQEQSDESMKSIDLVDQEDENILSSENNEEIPEIPINPATSSTIQIVDYDAELVVSLRTEFRGTYCGRGIRK